MFPFLKKTIWRYEEKYKTNKNSNNISLLPWAGNGNTWRNLLNQNVQSELTKKNFKLHVDDL